MIYQQSMPILKSTLPHYLLMMDNRKLYPKLKKLLKLVLDKLNVFKIKTNI